MKLLCELNDQIVLGRDGLTNKPPQRTARAVVLREDGLYAVMHSAKFRLYSLLGGGIEDSEDILTALRREILEETGCACERIRELGMVRENRGSQDYTNSL